MFDLRNIKKGIACFYCRSFFDEKIRKTKDHVVASSKGGLNTPDNYVDCCFRCNQWKRDKTLKDWLKEVSAWLYGGKKHPIYTKIQLGHMVGNIKKLIKWVKDNDSISIYKPN